MIKFSLDMGGRTIPNIHLLTMPVPNYGRTKRPETQRVAYYWWPEDEKYMAEIAGIRGRVLDIIAAVNGMSVPSDPLHADDLKATNIFTETIRACLIAAGLHAVKTAQREQNKLNRETNRGGKIIGHA